MATQCHTQSGFRFQRKLKLDFSGGQITSDAGLLVLREFDERIGFTAGLGRIVQDWRDRRYIEHPLIGLLRQRIYQIAAGYEDGNDATALRKDPTLRAVVYREDRDLASQPTISRLENAINWDAIRLLENEGTEQLCRHSARRRSKEIVLDVDSTDDRTHGQQQLSFFNHYYDSYVYHPILVFEAATGLLLGSRLRPGNAMGARQLTTILLPILRRLRSRFKRCAIALRGDSAFANHHLLRLAERHGLTYVIGIGRNKVFERQVEALCDKAQQQWTATHQRVRLYTSFLHQTRSWAVQRRIIAKVERTAEGMNVRFVVTNRTGSDEDLFHWYEQRGQAENFIKEFKNDVQADRLSCSAYRANAFRFQLHALAYNLLVLFRRQIMVGTELERANLNSLRLKLFKVGARVRRSCRVLWFHLATGWPRQQLLTLAVQRLASLGPPD
jgi:hypothetical protein